MKQTLPSLYWTVSYFRCEHTYLTAGKDVLTTASTSKANTRLIELKWVYTIKWFQDGSVERCKARLVPRGFIQRTGLNYQRPSHSTESIRTLLAVACTNVKNVDQLDVRTAYLNAPLHEDLYCFEILRYSRRLWVCRIQAFGQVLRLKSAIYAGRG
jgi:DNA polymerase zeta